MKLVNETNVDVNYWITSASGQADCGQIAVDGMADLPSYDNQQSVTVSFLPVGSGAFSTTWAATTTDEQTQLSLVAE